MAEAKHSAIEMVVKKELVCHQLDFDIRVEHWSDLTNWGCMSENTGSVASAGIPPGC